MNSKVKIKWGIIGLGNIAHQFASELLLVDGAEIRAVASRNLYKAQEFAELYNCKIAYGNYDEIIKDDSIDILYIATPHNSHAIIAIEALKNGKHVLCEKPIALNYNDALKMIETSSKYNKFFMEGFWTRFNPSFQEAYAKIKSGELGNVKYINADFAFYVEKPEGNRMTDMKLGGGSLLDIGVYPLFLTYMMLGIPNEILAKSNFHKSGADMQTSMILEYDNAQAILHSSFLSTSEMKATISGTHGNIILNPTWHMTESYTLVKNNKKKNYKLPKKGIGYTYEIEECHKCINEKKIESNLWSHKNSLDLIKMVDEVRKQVGLTFPSE